MDRLTLSLAIAAAIALAAGASEAAVARSRIVRVTRGGAAGAREAVEAQEALRAGRVSGIPSLEQMLKSFETDARLLAPLEDLAPIGLERAKSFALEGNGVVLSGGALEPVAAGSRPADSGHGALASSLAAGAQSNAAKAIPWRAAPETKGILFPDIYENNTVTSWDKLAKASHGIIIMKVRQTRLDHFYTRRIEEAEKRGMIVVGYAFGYGANGRTQADALLANFPLKPGRIIALDLEHNPYGSSMTTRQAIAFVERIRARTGRYPMLYASASTPRPGALARCIPYVADWSTHAPRHAAIWQFTDGRFGPGPHQYPGIAGISDINRLMITYASFRKLAGLDDAPGPAVASLPKH